MQIQLPDDPKMESRALSAGFASVEEYVRHLIEQADRQVPESVSKETKLQAFALTTFLRRMATTFESRGDKEQWKREFHALLELVEPGNPDFDDSRESIYPVR